MSERGIPRAVGTFITDHLTSVAQLEILLLVRESPEQTFTAEQVAERLRIDPSWAHEELLGLLGDGLLVHDDAADTFCFRPRSKELAGVIDGLARAFATHRVSVITLLFAAPAEGIGSFADAFKIRKDPDDG